MLIRTIRSTGRLIIAGAVSLSISVSHVPLQAHAGPLTELAKASGGDKVLDAASSAALDFAKNLEKVDPELGARLRKDIESGAFKKRLETGASTSEDLTAAFLSGGKGIGPRLTRTSPGAAGNSNTLMALLINSGDLACGLGIIKARARVLNFMIKNRLNDDAVVRAQMLLDYMNKLNRECRKQGFLGGLDEGAKPANAAGDGSTELTEEEKAIQEELQRIAKFTVRERQCYLIIKDLVSQYEVAEVAGFGDKGAITVGYFNGRRAAIRSQLQKARRTLDALKFVKADEEKRAKTKYTKKEIADAQKTYNKLNPVRRVLVWKDTVKLSDAKIIVEAAKRASEAAKQAKKYEKDIADLQKKIAGLEKEYAELPAKVAHQLKKLRVLQERIRRIRVACGKKFDRYVPSDLFDDAKKVKTTLTRAEWEIVKKILLEYTPLRQIMIGSKEPIAFQTHVSEPHVCVATKYTTTIGEGFESLRTIIYAPGEEPDDGFGLIAEVDETETFVEEQPEGSETVIMVTPDPSYVPTEELIEVIEESSTSESEEVVVTEETRILVPKQPSNTSGEPEPEEPEKTEPPEQPTEIIALETPTTDEPVKTEDPEQPADNPEEPLIVVEEVPDFGLVKAQDTVVEIALSGGDAAQAIEGTVIKLVGDPPPLPGSTELADIGELGEELFALADDAPAADSIGDAMFRTADAYASDVNGGIFDAGGKLELTPSPQLASLIDEDVVKAIGESMRSGELPPVNTLDRRVRAIWMKGLREATAALNGSPQSKPHPDGHDRYAGVGLEFKPKPKLEKKEGTGPEIEIPLDQMGGGTTNVAPPPPPDVLDKILEEDRKKREAAKKKKPEDDPEELGDGEEVLLSAPVPGEFQFNIKTESKVVSGEFDRTSDTPRITANIKLGSTPFTLPIVVALKSADSGDAPTQPADAIAVSIGRDSGLGMPKRKFKIGDTPLYIYNVSPEQFEEKQKFLQTSEHVWFVEEDPCREKEAEDPLYDGAGLWGQEFENQWAVKRVGFVPGEAGVWAKSNALAKDKLRPVTVAVIDSGIDWFHPDLPAKSLWKNADEIPENGKDDDGNGYVDDVIGFNFVDYDNLPWDQDGHGTFVSGVIAAGQENGTGIAGISSTTRVMALKSLDAFGNGHASMVAEAIIYAADNGADIINLSLGGRTPTNMERLAVAYAKKNDVLVIAAAGNDGKPVADYAPAGIEGVMTITATDRNDKRAGFSNWGPAIDVAAPGVDVLSLRARETDLLSLIRGVTYDVGAGVVGNDRAYFRASGTSFAAPIVSGTAAVILAARPDLTAEQLDRMIKHSTRDIETIGFDNFSGYGMLNASAAVEADPEYFVEARISRVRVVKVQTTQALQVFGTASANKFDHAQMFLGVGENPDKWVAVKSLIKKEKVDESLILLRASTFRSAKKWTLRLVVKHEDGTSSQTTYLLTLG